MGVATEQEGYKVNKLSLSKAEYQEYSVTDTPETKDVTSTLKTMDGDYLKFDFMDTANLYFNIPKKDKKYSKRSYVFAPVGYFETGGDPHPNAFARPMTAEKAQDFATVTPKGDYINHYAITPIDIDEFNEKYGLKEEW